MVACSEIATVLVLDMPDYTIRGSVVLKRDIANFENSFAKPLLIIPDGRKVSARPKLRIFLFCHDWDFENFTLGRRGRAPREPSGHGWMHPGGRPPGFFQAFGL